MNDELLEIYMERLRAYDPALVPEAAAGYFADLCGALSREKAVNAARFSFAEGEMPCEDLSSVLCVWYYEALNDYPQRTEERLRILETSIRLLCAFEEAYAERKDLPDEKTLRDIVWSYLHDYANEFTTEWFEKNAGSRLFITGDPLWGSLTERKGAAGEHAGDLSLFWGDRLKAGKLEALSAVIKSRKEAGETVKDFPGLYAPVLSEEAGLSFSSHQKNLFAEYAVKARKIYDEEN